MNEKEALKIAQKSVSGFPNHETLEKGDCYVFLFSGGKAIPDGIIVAVTSDGKVGQSIFSVEDAKENAKR